MGADYVLHVGGMVSPAADYFPKKTLKVNTTAAQYIVDAVKAQPNSDRIKVVYIGSVAQTGHRIFLFGGFMESLVPELKTMTEDEGKDFLYHIAKSTEAQEHLKKRAEGVEAG